MISKRTLFYTLTAVALIVIAATTTIWLYTTTIWFYRAPNVEELISDGDVQFRARSYSQALHYYTQADTALLKVRKFAQMKADVDPNFIDVLSHYQNLSYILEVKKEMTLIALEVEKLDRILAKQRSNSRVP